MILLALIQVALSTRSYNFQSSGISIFRELKGSGLKQELITRLTLPPSLTCTLQESITKDFFIDIEELPQTPSFKFSSKIDIELPASLSPAHTFIISLPNSLEFSYPIHLRYNDCSSTDLYKDLSLEGPLLTCGDLSIKVPDRLSFKVPIGNLEDTSIVISLTMATVLCSVIWISHTILNLRKST